MFCKVRRVHAVYRISLIVNNRHSGVGLGNNRNGNSLPDIPDDRYKLIRSYRTVDPNSRGSCALKGNSGFYGISAAENTSVSFYRNRTHNGKIADGIGGIHSGQSFLNIDHGFCCDQIHSCVFQNRNLFFIHFKGIFIGIFAVSSNKLAGGGNVSCHKGFVSCNFSGVGDQSTVDFLNFIFQSVLLQVQPVPSEGGGINDPASCFYISFLKLLDHIPVFDHPTFCADAPGHSLGHKIGTGGSVKKKKVFC